eukprot:7331366-Prymnesium_polylepis.1
MATVMRLLSFTCLWRFCGLWFECFRSFLPCGVLCAGTRGRRVWGATPKRYQNYQNGTLRRRFSRQSQKINSNGSGCRARPGVRGCFVNAERRCQIASCGGLLGLGLRAGGVSPCPRPCKVRSPRSVEHYT